MKAPRTEAELFSNSALDRDAVFVELYHRYVGDVFTFTMMALRTHDVRQTEQIVQQVFIRAHRYVHKFQPNAQRSYRLYLFELAEQVIEYYVRLPIFPAFTSPLPKVIAMTDWEIIRQFSTIEQRCCVLRYGLKLEVFEIAMVMQRDLVVVQRALQHCAQGINEHSLRQIYGGWCTAAVTTVRHPAKLLKRIQQERPVQLAFAQQRWWQRLVLPAAVTGTVIVVGAIVGLLWWNYPVRFNGKTPTAEVNDTPVFLPLNNTSNSSTRLLPVVQYNTHSLTQPVGTLYGTKYVHQSDKATISEEEMRPNITVNLPATALDEVDQAYIYATPDILTEVQLELLALRYFSSVPLNQFTYVNDTYYITESETQFRPLFIAFNNTGTVEFQMRQAAICTLPNLTAQISDPEANSKAFDFVRGHHFVEVDEEQVQMIRVSEDNRTLPKETFCKDGDIQRVQNRELVVFPPHTTLHYASGVNDLLPLRLPGIAVQMHGDTVTNMRLDKLNIVQEYATKADTVPLISLDDALTAVKQFYYPATDKQPEYRRFVRSFVAWEYSHWDERLKTVNVNKVKLEYVFDDLNRTIEPYYVFSGSAVDVNDRRHDDVRLYVVASVKNIELRSPYRE